MTSVLYPSLYLTHPRIADDGGIWDDCDEVLQLFEISVAISSLEKPLTLNMNEFLVRRCQVEDFLPIETRGPRVVSNNFKKLIDSLAPECVQWIPFNLSVSGNIKSEHKFHAMHVIKSFGCIDLERSKYDLICEAEGDEPQVILLFDWVMIKPNIDDAPMIFQESSYPVVQLVKNEFKVACEDLELNLDFEPIEEIGYSNPPAS